MVYTGGTTHQEKVVILRLCMKILEDGLLPITLHVIPVINLTMANWIIYAISGGFGVRERLVSDEEIEVLDATFGREVARLCRHGRTCPASLRGGSARGDRGREDTV